MAFITRADGVHFVIPSYRDLITLRSASTFKKAIQGLSASYGEYITLQQKGPVQYEAAFSPDTGYLLGESIWHYFKRPLDMIYCEALPNSTEAILVIVQAGSVYLDGSFPVDSIQDELVIFLTQKNNFDIYTFGDVPIAQMPEEGKFSFEASSVRSFTILETPVFATLPLIKSYQLQLVDTVIQEHGIGVLPVKKMVIGAIIAVLLIATYEFVTAPSKEKIAKKPVIVAPKVNPFKNFNAALTSPAPEKVVAQVLSLTSMLYTMPGWSASSVTYTGGNLTAMVKSNGTNITTLQDWADRNRATLSVTDRGVLVSLPINIPNRNVPDKIYPLKSVIIHYIDNLATIYPGNHMRFSGLKQSGIYYQSDIEVSIDKLSPAAIGLIGKGLEGFPFTISKMSLKMGSDGLLSGTILINAVGS